MKPRETDRTPDALRAFGRRMTCLLYAVAAAIVIAIVFLLNFWN